MVTELLAARGGRADNGPPRQLEVRPPVVLVARDEEKLLLEADRGRDRLGLQAEPAKFII